MEDLMPQIKLCAVSEFGEENVKTFRVGKKDIAVFKVEDTFYAIDRKCTHLKGNLAKGKLVDKTIQCPLHGAIFNLKTGELLKQPGTLAGWFKKAKNTTIYRLLIKDDFLFLEE